MELQWPLILFTTFIAWSCGLFAVQGIYAVRGEGAKAQLPSLICSLVLMVIGGIAVFTHLKHWERIFNGFGHITSGITQELIAIVIVGIVMVAYFVMLRRSEDGNVPQWLGIVAIIVAVILVVVMGHSYMMAARPTWNSLIQIFSLIGAAFALGAGTFAAINAATAEEPSELNGAICLVGNVVNVLAVVAFLAYMVSSAGSLIGAEWYIDMTDPTAAKVTAAQFSPFTSDNMPMSIVALVASVAGFAFAYLGKVKGNWKVWGATAAICAAVSAVALRMVFYAAGGTAYMIF